MTARLIFGDASCSGADIERRAQRLAGGLSRSGVGEGDVVAVMLRNDPAYTFATAPPTW